MLAAMTLRVFVDASMLFAASYSTTGSAKDLMRLAVQERVQIVLSSDVLEETRRNLHKKAWGKTTALDQLILLIELFIVDPTLEQVRAAEGYTAHKDAPIVAAAIAAGVDYLVTYDRCDLLDPPEVAKGLGCRLSAQKRLSAS